MARKQKPEEVTASFHFMARTQNQNEEQKDTGGFSQNDFDALCDTIIQQPEPDLTDPNEFDKLKFGQVVPFPTAERIDKRCLFGVYEGAYSGHSFKNSDKGKISADSINQRRFHFLLYLSDSGRIYISTQYLGLYGAYVPLKNTLLRLLPERKNVQVNTVRIDAVDLSKAVAKEVKVSLSSKGKEITSKNLFSEGSMVAVRKRRKDDSFPTEVNKSLFSLISSPLEKRKKAIGDLLRNSSIAVNDDDIEGCSVLASINGRDRTIYILDGCNFASKFHIEVGLNQDGHPDYEQTKKEMRKLLKNEIISKTENV